jgi:hypothetical protein
MVGSIQVHGVQVIVVYIVDAIVPNLHTVLEIQEIRLQQFTGVKGEEEKGVKHSLFVMEDK